MKATRWRLITTFIVLVIGLSQLYPVKDMCYVDFLLKNVKHNKKEFVDVLNEAKNTVNHKCTSLFINKIINLANEKKLDLGTCFTQLNTSDIKNFNKRNKIILQHLFQKTQSVFKQGLDLKGGVSCILSIDDRILKSKGAHDSLINKTIDIIKNRIDVLGVYEPIVRPYGDCGIEVQLPGVSLDKNPNIIKMLKKPAVLEFKLVDDSRDQLYTSNFDINTASNRASIYEKMQIFTENINGNEIIKDIWVKKSPEMIGDCIKEAHAYINQNGKYEVALTMTKKGKEKFEAITTKNINKRLAIVLDNKVISAPYIESAIINGNATINGNFSKRDAIELANALNNPLTLELNLDSVSEIGPSLAVNSKNSAIITICIGVAVLWLVMTCYYKCAGFVSGLSLILNFILIVVSWAILGVTVTLPSITALALTLGMAVDANVLIYERTKEEIVAGKNISIALEHGNKRAFITIFDSNVTTLLVAIVLISFSTGAIKGFGITLFVGVLTTLFSVLIFCRAIIDILSTNQMIRFPIVTFFSKINLNIFNHKKHVLFISMLLLAIGCIGFIKNGKNVLGIDFLGGDELVIESEKDINCDKIRKILNEENFKGMNIVQQKSVDKLNKIFKIQTSNNENNKIFEILKKRLQGNNLKYVLSTKIGATMSTFLCIHALLSIIIALVIVLIYIWIRFEYTCGISTIVALIYDVIMTVGICVFCGYQFNSQAISAILLVIGYSINDKIIIFDRIREIFNKNDDNFLPIIINQAVNKTISRTMITSLTTLIPTVLLFMFCTGIVRLYAFIFMIGILIGTFSSIFIAGPVFAALNCNARNVISLRGLKFN